MSDALTSRGAGLGRALQVVGRPPAAVKGGAGVVALAVLLVLGISTGPYYMNILVLTFFAVSLAVSYRLLLHTREASFCHGSFYMLGAYSTALLTTKEGWPFWATVPAAGIVAAVAALVIGLPSLRTSGPYFFLITFGFLVVLGSIASNATSLTGGFSGINAVLQPTGINTQQKFYFASLVLAVVSVVVFAVFDRSRWGLELIALGDSSDLAQATGTGRLSNMLFAFTVGAFFAGLTGSFYASYITFVSPNSFTLWTSIYILMYVVVGGARYITGAVVGAAVLTLLPVAFGWSPNLVAVFEAAVTLTIVLLAPRGVVVELVELIRSLGTRLTRSGQTAAGTQMVEPAATGVDRASVSAPAPVPDRDRRETPGDVLLDVRNLSLHFGGVRAVDDVSFLIRKQETLGVIGPNGAGKTTLFNCISGFAQPDSGSATFEGRSILGLGPHHVARLGLVRTFQASVVFERLSVYDNLLVGCRPKHVNLLRAGLMPVRRIKSETDRADEMLEAFGLTPWAGAEAGAIPYGIRKVLGVAICVAARPKLLCLDEPLAGLHGLEVERMQTVLGSLADDHGISLMLIEHRMPVVMSICQRLVVLNFGRLLVEGTPDDVRSDPRVIEAYLGEEAPHAPSTA